MRLGFCTAEDIGTSNKKIKSTDYRVIPKSWDFPSMTKRWQRNKWSFSER